MPSSNRKQQELSKVYLRVVDAPNYRARFERVVLFGVVAFDWNCSQRITPPHGVQAYHAQERTGP